MFRLFLIERLSSGSKTSEKVALPKKQYRNRRLYERLNVDHKHMTLMNDQDILLIRNLSSHGFSCEVSERYFNKITVGDIYLCRLRYVNEIYELKAKVSWKDNNFVGFQLVEETPKIQAFIERLLRPLRIGSSLKKQDSKVQQAPTEKTKIWFHGDEQSDLFVWVNDRAELSAWCLEIPPKYIEWHHDRGLESGSLTDPELPSLSAPWDKKRKKDQAIDQKLKQLALDIFQALDYERNDELIAPLNNK